MSDDGRFERPTNLPPPTNLHGPDDPEMEALLSRALRQEAESIRPTERLDQIRTEARRQSRPTGRTVLGVVAAALVLVVGGGIVGTVIVQQNAGQEAGSAAPGATRETTLASGPVSASPVAPSTTPSSPPGSSSSSPSSSASATGSSVPVYWIGPNNKLFREFLPPVAGDRAVGAVRHMLASTPRDPDYRRGPWASAAATSGDITVIRTGENLTVSLPGSAFDTSRSVTKGEATAAIQQLVHTVTAATQAQGTVTVLIDGKPGRAWGQVDVGSPVRRDTNARSAVWITDPEYEGQPHTAGTVTVIGNSTAFEGTVQWTVTRPDGSVVAEGHTMGGANGTFANFTFSTTLPAGTYLVTVFAPDMSGQGRDVGSDSKTIVVR